MTASKEADLEVGGDAAEVAELVDQVRAMVAESGTADGFDAEAWTLRWLNEPVPALDDVAPITLMRTEEGRALILATLSRMQSGAYA